MIKEEKMLEKTFCQLRVFVFDFIPKNENAESGESFIKILPTLWVIFTDEILIFRNLKPMLLYSRISFTHPTLCNFCSFIFQIKDRSSGFLFQITIYPNEAMKQACVPK